MAEQSQPTSDKQVPDPSDTYERSHPEHEAGQGRMDHNAKATPTPRQDQMPMSVRHAQDGGKQINSQEAATRPRQPDHSMLEEEPLGWDQTPQDITDPEAKRHPRTGGKGGTPDATEDLQKG